MRQVIIISILLILCQMSFGQRDKTIELENIQGQAIGGINTAPIEVIERAIKNAKINALTKAGIHEEINTYQNLFRSETAEEYEEVFMSDVFTNISGVVQSVIVKDTVARFDPTNYGLKVTVITDATVIKYATKEDRTFDAWVKGIKSVYPSSSLATFELKPTQDCYVRAFLIAREQESYQLFPNEYEKDFMLKANQVQKFPTLSYLDYELTTKMEKEPHRIIIVMVKEQIPYTSEVAYKPILDWIFSIPPEKRIVKSFGITVIKN